MVTHNELLTPEEVAELLKIDVRTVYQYIKDKKINAVKLSRKIIRIPLKEVTYLFPKEKKND